jgi:hypothetical protein
MGVVEAFVGDLSRLVGWAMVVFAASATVWRSGLTLDGFVGGLLTGATALVGGVLLLGAGVTWVLLALGWLAKGLIPFHAVGLGVGAVLALTAVLALVARRHAVKTRYNPRFFSARQFETMIQLADVMIHRVGRSDDHPIQVAVDTDHELAKQADKSPGQLRAGFFLLEWVAPILVGLPIPFSDLGTHTRRRILQKAARRRRIFQPVLASLTIISNTQRMQTLKESANRGSE